MSTTRQADHGGPEQEALHALNEAVRQRYAERGIPGALRLLEGVAKWVGLFTAGAGTGEDANLVAAQKIREHLALRAATSAPGTWARDRLTADQRHRDEETLQLLVEELRLLQEHRGTARMLDADPVFSLMMTHGGGTGTDAVEANRAASQNLQDYLLRLRQAREAVGPGWWDA